MATKAKHADIAIARSLARARPLVRRNLSIIESFFVSLMKLISVVIPDSIGKFIASQKPKTPFWRETRWLHKTVLVLCSCCQHCSIIRYTASLVYTSTFYPQPESVDACYSFVGISKITRSISCIEDYSHANGQKEGPGPGSSKHLCLSTQSQIQKDRANIERSQCSRLPTMF